jgi:rubredoxin
VSLQFSDDALHDNTTCSEIQDSEGAGNMMQCQGNNCGYIYNEKKGDRKGGISPGTKFEDLPDDWKCPVCGAGKKFFKVVEE